MIALIRTVVNRITHGKEAESDAMRDGKITVIVMSALQLWKRTVMPVIPVQIVTTAP